MQNAWKVGLLVVIFGGLIFGAYLVLGKNLFAPQPIRVDAVFSDAGGINPGARIQMAGVTIGTVESVRLETPTQAILKLAINHDIKVPKGSTAVLATSFIGIGDNPINLVPPTTPTTELLLNGDVIQGKRLGPLDGIAPDLVPNLNVTLSELNKTLAVARDLVGDKGIRQELVAVLDQTSKTLENFGNLAAGANSTLDENRVAIRDTLKTFAAAMVDVEKTARLAADLLADPKYKKQAGEILASLNSTAKRADNLMANVESIVADPDLKAGIKKTVGDMNSITDSGTRIASNTEKMTANGVSASENVVELTKKVNALADDAKEVLEKIKNFFVKPTSGGVLSNLGTQVDVTREFEPSRLRVDVNAKYPIPGGSVYAGVHDAFESNKLNLQLARPLGKNGEYRYGMFAGKAGLGVEYAVTPKVKVRGDLYGLNNTRLDVRTEFDLRKDFLGFIGIDRVSGRNSISVGVGIRK